MRTSKKKDNLKKQKTEDDLNKKNGRGPKKKRRQPKN